jgi:hypothetical protein
MTRWVPITAFVAGQALCMGLSNAYFRSLGFPSLFEDC